MQENTDILELDNIFDENGIPLSRKSLNFEEEIALLKAPKKRGVGRPKKGEEINRPVDDKVIQYQWASDQQKTFVNFSPPSTKNERGDTIWENSGEILFSGAVGSAKSFSLCLAILRYIMIPNTKVLLCRLNLSDLKKSTLKMLLEEEIQTDGTLRNPLLPPGAIKNYNKSEGIIYLYNGSQIIMSGASNIEKVRSINVSAAFVEELSELTNEQYLAVTQRCRTFCGQANIIFSCTNPKHKGHWIYQYFVVNSIPKIREMLTVTAYDNKLNITTGYIKQLEMLPEPERSRMLLGEWTDDGDMVFHCFNRDLHIAHNLSKNKYDSYLIGQDFGGGAGECGMVLLGQKDNKIYCLEEFCKKRTSHTEALNWMEQYRDITRGVCVYDSANAALATDMINASWKLIKSIKDLEGSFTVLNGLFSQNSIEIDSSCITLIKQIEGASRTPLGTVSKLSDWDVLDAFRYGICAIHLNDTKQYAAKPKRDVFIARF